MGFLRRLLGRPVQAEPDRQVQAWMLVPDRDDAALDVVGESQYQEALLGAAGGRGWDGALNADHSAVLVWEPKNAYDSNAIAVWIGGLRVGYLSREDAVRYGPLFRWAAASDHSIACQARLTGGWDRGDGDQGSLGVVLHLGSPAECLVDILDEELVVALEHPWPGHLVAFTGGSSCRLHGVALDREGSILLAHRAGLRTHPRVTKAVQLLVDCDPASESGNHRKALEYGIPVVTEHEFWTALEVPVEAIALTPAWVNGPAHRSYRSR